MTLFRFSASSIALRAGFRGFTGLEGSVVGVGVGIGVGIGVKGGSSEDFGDPKPLPARRGWKEFR